MLGRNDTYRARVYVSNGAVASFTVREMHALYTSWQLWVLTLVGFLIMATGHPVTLPQFDSFGLRLAFWLVALAFYLGLSTVYAPLVCRGWGAVFGRPIPLIVMSLPLVLACTYATSALLTVLFTPGQPLFAGMSWQMNLRNVFVAHVFETVALLWLLPAQRARHGMADARTITLAGRRFDLGDIRRIKAAEHLLEVHGASDTQIIRERMATFLEQVAPGDGIQTHRSHWVAATAVSGMRDTVLALRDGGSVPVARGRLRAVRDWLNAQPRGEPVGGADGRARVAEAARAQVTPAP